MTRVYVDLDAVSADPTGGPGIDAAAARSLGFLEEAGHGVTLVAIAAVGRPQLQGRSTIDVDEVPVRPADRAWYVTTDADRCRSRSALLRTILIGFAPAGAIHRCNSIARDLQAAVLEILAAEAMP